jgi:hypothetical protein
MLFSCFLKQGMMTRNSKLAQGDITQVSSIRLCYSYANSSLELVSAQ